MHEPPEQLNDQPALFIGIDWADQKHDCYVIDRDGKGFHQEIKHSPENIDTWVGEMLELAGGKPIAIMLEQSRGPLVYSLMFRKNVLLYPVNPKQSVRYRESYPGSGKDDPTDARYLARMLRERITTLTAWQPDDENTRLLAHLCQQRRKMVDGQIKLRQHLVALLKSYFPVVLELFGTVRQLPLLLSVLGRWNDPRKFRRADRRLIRRVLSDHSIRNEKQQDEIIDRVRTAQLLCDDEAVITPSAMAVKLMVSQIQQSRKNDSGIRYRDRRSDEAASRCAPLHKPAWCGHGPGPKVTLRVWFAEGPLGRCRQLSGTQRDRARDT
jgi:hypothetical protein